METRSSVPPPQSLPPQSLPPESLRSAPPQSLRRLVIKNTLYLTAAQVLTVPLSILMNGVMARYLGPEDFGYVYLAMTLTGFGFLAVDWGQHGALPALIAQQRSEAGKFLGSSIAWRTGSSVFVYVALALGCHFLGYSTGLQWALALVFLGSVVSSVIAACKDTVRGFERTDIPAYAHVGQQILAAALVIPVMMLGGQLRAALVAHIVAGVITLAVVWRTLVLVGVHSLSFGRDSLRSLLVGGTPFVFFGLAMVLTPNIDAIYLSKMAPPEVMGWYGVSRRLIGVLIFPATALIGALYPTLCRLHGTNQADFNRAASGSLRGITMLVVPAAIGTALFPEIGIAIFSRSAFFQAENNLRIMSVFLFLVYFSMPLGTIILAAGKQRAWTIVQCLCVAVSLGLDPLLIPYFQNHYGNGGLGLCVAGVVSEALVVGCGIVLAPKGVFDRRMVKPLLLAFIAGAGMVVVGILLKHWNLWVGAVVASIVYVVLLYLLGGVEQEYAERVRSLVARKAGMFKRGQA
jgi:O-antigen/teichoic acid export membrane protein